MLFGVEKQKPSSRHPHGAIIRSKSAHELSRSCLSKLLNFFLEYTHPRDHIIGSLRFAMQMKNCAQLLAKKKTMRLCKPQSNLRQFLGISQNSLFLLHQAIGGSWPFWGRVQNAHIYGTGPQRASVSCWLTYKPPIFCCFSYCSSISILPQQLHVMRTHTCSHCPTWQSHMYLRQRRRVHCYARPMAMQMRPGSGASRNNPLRMHWTLSSCRRTATWRMRNICNIYNNSTWPRRTTPLPKVGGLPISQPYSVKIAISKALKIWKMCANCDKRNEMKMLWKQNVHP